VKETQRKAHFGMKDLAKTNNEKKFDNVLLDAIDLAFSALGQNVKFTIYFNLETKFELPKKTIPDRISDFSNALDQIFGQAARSLEILIMKYLNDKVKCNYSWVGPKWLVPDLTFEKYINLVRMSVEGSGKIGDVEVLLNDYQRPEQET
jgi:hypothetical protein